MKPHFALLSATLLATALSGCFSTTTVSGGGVSVTTSTPGGPVGTAEANPTGNAGVEQLRLSLTPSLRSAGVPDACIAQLTRPTLAEVKGLTTRSSRGSREYITRRQRIRTAAARDCPGL